jgi:predicted RNase H-like HicB family nuclease
MGPIKRGLIKLFNKPREATDGPRFVFHYEVDREEDGRYLVEITDLPGVMAYGATADEATRLAASLALRVVAEQIENGETPVKRQASILTPA